MRQIDGEQLFLPGRIFHNGHRKSGSPFNCVIELFLSHYLPRTIKIRDIEYVESPVWTGRLWDAMEFICLYFRPLGEPGHPALGIAKAHERLVTFAEFFASNRGWIQRRPISAEPDDDFTCDTLHGLYALRLTV